MLGARPRIRSASTAPEASNTKHTRQRITAPARVLNKDFWSRVIISKLAGVAYTKLELAAAAIVLIVMDGNTVIEPERTDGKIQAKAQTPVISEVVQGEVVRIGSHV